MTRRFAGETAEFYARFRQPYPEEIFDQLREAFALTGDDTVLDLGCGTGLTTLPMAGRAGTVIGMDPEPDMLHIAREAALRAGAENVSWVLGADTDLPALAAALGPRSGGGGALSLLTIGQALHMMDARAVFSAAAPMLRPGGGVAVLSNGSPLWRLDEPWSRALREFLTDYLGRPPAGSCGTSAEDRERYAARLRAAGYHGVRELAHSATYRLSVEQLVGGTYSAIPTGELPAAEDRPAFAERVRRALPPEEDGFTAELRSTALIGFTPAG